MTAFAAFFCLGMVVLFLFCYEQKQKKEHEAEVMLLKQQLEGVKNTVYVAAKDLQRGELATREKLHEAEYHTNQPADWFMTEEEIGRELRVAVKEGTPLLTAMFLEEEGSGQREVFFFFHSHGWHDGSRRSD